jgi:hydroxymethylglutaryl-CoA reductase
MADDISDHLITAKIVEEMLDIDIIYNADIWTAEQYEKVAASEVFGVRIKKANAVTNIFGVL